ncbi:MAG: YggT family protein [Proteobacteria bacterium]|nr:YggT family protein [Pseudomonadota bacterium]
MAHAIANLIFNILSLYELVVFIYILFGWLLYFGILNQNQPVVRKINEVVSRLVEPVLRYFRRIIPPISGIDLSPIALFLVIYFFKDLLRTVG